MKFKVIYWSAGGREVERVVEAENADEAWRSLIDDPQEPLGQLKEVREVKE